MLHWSHGVKSLVSFGQTSPMGTVSMLPTGRVLLVVGKLISLERADSTYFAGNVRWVIGEADQAEPYYMMVRMAPEIAMSISATV